MPTAFTKGDIFETEGLHAYAFGSTTDGTMSSGIAIAMKKRWPELAEAYATHCEGGHERKAQLGEVFAWTKGEVTVYALVIYGTDGKPRLSALNQATRKMLDLAAAAKVKRIGLPRIGTGAAGLDWTRVRKMLGEITVNHLVRLDVFEQFVRAPKTDGEPTA